MRREDLKIIADDTASRGECRQSAWAKYQKPRRGVPTGFGLAVSGGPLPKLASGQRGSGGRAVQLALTI